MFRQMKRINQQLSKEDCIELLKNEKRGVLSVIGDDEYPYGIPLDFLYDENENMIYFQGCNSGHKIDAIRKNNKVSFCIYDNGQIEEGDIGLTLKSVIVFGRINIVKNSEKTLNICRRLNKKFNFDEESIEYEIQKFANVVTALALTPEHITGKFINES